LLPNIHHFDNSRHTWKRCKGNSQNSETRALIKTPVGWLTVERYSQRHLAAQVRSTNGLRGIFKFSKILGSTTYMPACFTASRLTDPQQLWLQLSPPLARHLLFPVCARSFTLHPISPLGYSAWSLDPQDESTRILRNVANYSPNDTASRRRSDFTAAPLWDFRVLQFSSKAIVTLRCRIDVNRRKNLLTAKMKR
jgi:hypothetical protein